METYRSLKTECPGSICGGRHFFILISFLIYIFSHFFYNAVNFKTFFLVMDTSFRGNSLVNSLLCHSNSS